MLVRRAKKAMALPMPVVRVSYEYAQRSGRSLLELVDAAVARGKGAA